MYGLHKISRHQPRRRLSGYVGIFKVQRKTLWCSIEPKEWCWIYMWINCFWSHGDIRNIKIPFALRVGLDLW